MLSTKRHKTLRFGLNWVVLGVAVPLPFRDDRYFCLPVLWRCYRKKGQAGHRSRTQLAARMAHHLAESLPDRTFWLVGDSAYINSELMKGRPENLRVLGPLRWDAALYERPGPYPGQGRPAKKGKRLPTPLAMIEDTARYPAELETIEFPKLERSLRVQVVRDVLWYTGCGEDPVVVVLVRDPLGQWRDETLVATDPTASAPFVILGYCRRWCVELAFFDSKQYLGLHDPRAWCERSVERAHPMAILSSMINAASCFIPELSGDFPSGTPVEALQPAAPVSGRQATSVSMPAPTGSGQLYVSDGNAFALNELIRLTSPGGDVTYHRLTQNGAAVAPEVLLLQTALSRAHPAGSEVVQRGPQVRARTGAYGILPAAGPRAAFARTGALSRANVL